VFCLACLYYHKDTHANLTEFLAIFSLTIATGLHLIFFFLTVVQIFKRRVFVPDEKFDPTAFIQLTHYALRQALDDMEFAVQSLDKPESERKFAELFELFHLVHEEHSGHEDHVLFPVYNAYVPNCTAGSEQQHGALHKDLQALAAMVRKVRALPDNKESADERSKLHSQIRELFQFQYRYVNEHFDEEEENLSWIGRHYVPIQTGKEIVHGVWNRTSPCKWAKILPFVINFNPIHSRRVDLLRAFRWAMPEKIQVVGRMVYEGVDPLMWDRLAADVPEMIPRNVRGWVKRW